LIAIGEGVARPTLPGVDSLERHTQMSGNVLHTEIKGLTQCPNQWLGRQDGWTDSDYNNLNKRYNILNISLNFWTSCFCSVSEHSVPCKCKLNKTYA